MNATSTDTSTESRRILIVDDSRAIHQDFRKILIPDDSGSALDDQEAALFGMAPAAKSVPGFSIDSAYQGQEALALVQRAVEERRPYAMTFMDVRMPPGWDGVQTAARLW